MISSSTMSAKNHLRSLLPREALVDYLGVAIDAEVVSSRGVG